MQLMTVGYEGTSIEDFVAFLKQNKVRLIADVRKTPMSRKKGFSKNRLAENLRAEGIEYLHFPELGMPSAWRKANKEKKLSRHKMFELYVEKVLPLKDQEFEKIEALLKKPGVALLCFEADCTDCHRSHVADHLLERSRGQLKMRNLELTKTSPKSTPQRPSSFR